MMDYFINITITTSITAFVILIVKAILKNKISPNWQFLIWSILAIRLLIPVFPESNMSIFNSVPQIKNIEISQKAVENISAESKSFVTGNIVLGEREKKFIFSEALVNNIFFIWAIGAIIILLFMIVTYYSFHKKTSKLQTLKDSETLSILDKCRKAVGINRGVIVKLGGETPLLKGIIKPEILLPEGYTIEELYSVFTHELLHLKHKDVLWNIISTLLLCVYWYNPIMWYCFFIFRRDMEILCDYRVVEINKNKKEYASVLLKTALKKNKFILGTTSLQNGEKDVTKRIKYIVYFKKPKVIWSIAAISIGILVTAICLTNPVVKSYTKVNSKFNAEKLYQYKTQYVGAAYKIGNLTDYLNYSEYKNGFSLQTDSEPYGITVTYKIKPEVLWQNNISKANSNMLENAAVIFCLVDNVGTVTFKFDDGEKISSFSFKREIFNSVFKKDIREYSSSLKTFKEEFLPMLEKQDWSEIYDPKTQTPEQVVKNYFKFYNEKNKEKLLTTLTDWHKAPNVVWGFDNLKYIKVIKIEDDTKAQRDAYMHYGRGKINGVKEENVRVYKVDYEVKYKKDGVGPEDSGKYTKWYTVIKENDNSPWLIDDGGEG